MLGASHALTPTMKVPPSGHAMSYYVLEVSPPEPGKHGT